MMNKQILIILITVLLVSCSRQKKKGKLVDKEATEVENIDSQIDSLVTTDNDNAKNQNVVERYFPKEKEIHEFDTIISARNLRISIQNIFLDTYVTDEFDSEGITHIDKYRDSEKHLVIEQSNEILIDTVFKKNDFEKLAGQDFLQIADFHGYWFNAIKNDTIELFGVISKPETD
ncbi:hypothetical protein WJR50_30920 [Catalinimonas sp. 4WD22]|uniref:hypothetical protein n=1 Tax=Catalinimonas locisalis TaxID=3133978 RepID=UPI003100BE3F